MASGGLGRNLGGAASRLALAVGLVAAVSSVSQAQQPAGPIQMGTSFDCARSGAGQSIPALVCQTPELQIADLHQMQAYYTLRHAQPQRQQELRNQFTSRIQALVRECSTEQVRASGSQPACVTQALGNLRGFWLEQLQQTGNAAALEEARLPSGNFVGAQQALRTSGFLPANAVVDGVYGSGTREAIARFQAERGITSNGFLTQTTLAALRRASLAGAGTAGAPAAATSAAAPVAQQPSAGSTNQTAQAQPAPRTQANPPSNPQQTSPRSAATPAQTGATTQEQLATAQRALEARDYQTALRIYRPLAEQGVPAAQGAMARLTFNGWGVNRDQREGLRWAQLGAAQNDPASLNTVGVVYLRGNIGLPQDFAQARQHFERAARQNFPLAFRNLAEMHAHGHGGNVNMQEAIRLWNAGAALGDTGSMVSLSNVYARVESRNCQISNQLLRQAVDLNDAWALRVMALRHEPSAICRLSNDPRRVEVFRFMRLAADAGDGEAQLYMGIALAGIRGRDGYTNAAPELDPAQAVEYLRLAVAQNVGFASQALQNAERALAEHLHRSQLQNQTAQMFPSYYSREPTLLEQVFNYSTTGDTRGNSSRFWVSGHNRGNACILTPFGTQPLDPNAPRALDVRSINQTAFRISTRSETGNILHMTDDRGFRLLCLMGCEVDRLRNAWALAFRECPGQRSAF
jgi:TPR repeat protein